MSESNRWATEETFHDAHARPTEDGHRQGTSRYYECLRSSYANFEKSITEGVKGRDALEVGCGLGNYSRMSASCGANVTGIDLSPGRIETARMLTEDAGVRVRYEVMNACALTFPDQSFDLVFGGAILHHLDLDAALSGLARILRSGGRAVFLEPLGYNPAINLYRRFTPETRTPDEHPFRAGDFRTLERYFHSVDIRYYGLASLGASLIYRTPVFVPLRAVGEGIDALLLRLPGLKWLAWQVVMTLREPQP
jgi:SAM-dependent methyltransferase